MKRVNRRSLTRGRTDIFIRHFRTDRSNGSTYLFRLILFGWLLLVYSFEFMSVFSYGRPSQQFLCP